MHSTTAARSKRAYLDARLQADIAFPTKFHRPILEDDEARALVETRFRAVAKAIGATFLHLEVASHHVRMRVELPPDLSPLQFITRIKSESSRSLFARFPALKSRLTTIWPWSAYVRSSGNPTPGGIEDYLLLNRGLHPHE
jgi:REP element-mobilizing transposase RayT